MSGVCLVRSLSCQEFVFQEFEFQEFVFQEFVFQEFVMAPFFRLPDIVVFRLVAAIYMIIRKNMYRENLSTLKNDLVF